MKGNRIEEIVRLITFLTLSGILVYSIHTGWEYWGWIILLMVIDLMRVGIRFNETKEDKDG